MKLWDSLTTCLVLLSAVRVSALLRNRRRSADESPLDVPPVQMRLSMISPGNSREDAAEDAEEELFRGDVVEFIKIIIRRVRLSSSYSSSFLRENFNTRTRHRRERKRAALESDKGIRRDPGGEEMIRKVRRGGGSGRRQSCVLKQIHLNVSDLGLGYLSSEEMIFRYCSGPCRKSETNYDKILSNLVFKKRLPPKDRPPQACCRPIAYDDDISFLDDSLVYHTVRKHSARKCGCV
nr:glial cell line-derived neurotrophic factor [Nothobranchius furzeri]